MFLLKRFEEKTNGQKLEQTQTTDIKKNATHEQIIKKMLFLIMFFLLAFVISFVIFKSFKITYITTENKYGETKNDVPDSNFFMQSLGFIFLITMISGVLSCFLFDLAWLTTPIFTLSLGSFLGIFSDTTRYFVPVTQGKPTNQNSIFIFMSVFIFFLMSNFFITILLYYKKFRKQKNQAIANKITFVGVNFCIVTITFLLLFSFIVAIVDPENIKIFKNVWVIIVLLIFSGIVATSSLVIASALCLLDVIIEKQINNKYVASLAFILFVLMVYPIFKMFYNAFKKRK
ncbi:putative membrane protein [Candidatus Phytoplasma solani]|uniref:hypothetical protein n=1 Tax=Candidatus Phytoplasma solani TaxID=69896 RepID=UPI0032DB9B45